MLVLTLVYLLNGQQVNHNFTCEVQQDCIDARDFFYLGAQKKAKRLGISIEYVSSSLQKAS